MWRSWITAAKYSDVLCSFVVVYMFCYFICLRN